MLRHSFMAVVIGRSSQLTQLTRRRGMNDLGARLERCLSRLAYKTYALKDSAGLGPSPKLSRAKPAAVLAIVS